MAVKLAAIKAVRDALDAAEKDAKAALAAAGMGPGDRVHARVSDGVSGGTVSMSAPKGTWKVRDEDAFTRWVQESRPDEIVPSVRASYKTHVLRNVEKTGEVPDGVEFAEGSSFVTVRLTDEQRQAITEALMGGEVDWKGLLAIESAPDE